MAQDVNATVDRDLINRVVDAMAAKLTDHANIQALVDPPAGQNPNAATSKAIQEATAALLEPLFAAKAAKNACVSVSLQPGVASETCATAQEPSDPSDPGEHRARAVSESRCPSALHGSDQGREADDLGETLGDGRALPISWRRGIGCPPRHRSTRARSSPIFSRTKTTFRGRLSFALSRLSGAMRQGFRVNAPRDAEMATAAMRLLTDFQAKPEVRAEAARALGLMEITSAVRGYNFPLVAHATGQLAAELGTQIGSNFKNNPLKSRYLTVLLAGPVFEAFDGVQGMRDSGLMHNDERR